MANAVITYINDDSMENLEKDFLESLRKDICFKGFIYVIYYGDNKSFMNRIKKKYNAKVIISKNQYTIYNQRNIEIAELLKKLPKEVSNCMCIDGGDVWFQKPIEEIFDSVKDSYGFIEESTYANNYFNLKSIKKLEDENAQKEFLKNVRGYKLINSGMIVGNKRILEELFENFAQLTKKFNKNYYGFDQAIFNHVIRKDGRGISLPKRYCFPIFIFRNQFEVKNRIFYEISSGERISIVHNLGWYNRILTNGRKDMIPILQNLKKLKGSFWGITTHFNPAGYKNKIINYKKFRENSKKQGLKLLCVELAFNNKPFELTKNDADILIQVRNNDILWQKERLINIGIKNLPKDCDKFAWLDADLLFLNNNWIKETSKLLEQYPIIQPFSISVRLPKGTDSIDINKINFGEINDQEGCKSNSVAYRVAQLGKVILDKNIDIYGHVGMAWAGRKSIFEKYGVLDKSIFPNSDSFMAHIFYNGKINKECQYFTTPAMEKEIENWAKKVFPKINGSVYYTDGAILHLWHGSVVNRNYKECNRILNKYNFNPDVNLKICDNGCWQWNTSNIYLKNDVKKYFLIRKEENSLRNKLNLFYYNIFEIYENSIYKAKKIINKGYLIIDRGIGIIGLIIQIISPEVYHSLKKSLIKD